MILYDRLTNSQQDVDCVQSGRYQVLKPITINGHTNINEQEIIFSDGKRTCDLNSQPLSFQIFPESPLQSLFEDAILTLSEVRTQSSIDLPSPLLPANLITEDSELSALEKRLIEVLEKGHLHHISQQPRIDLKYDEAVVEVSRARRMTNKTLSHLGSHSECWQRRTLTGVMPRKVLTRYSEDDYETYENRVYASLLDKLEIHLQWRLKRLVVLTESMDDALSFQDSEEVHYRLRNKICSLWGEVFDPEKTSTQLSSSREILEILKACLKKIQSLKQQGLYAVLHQGSRVSGDVYHTNILKHDDHYRHLPLLWDALAKVSIKKLKPEEVFARNKKLNQAYLDYIDLVLRRALEPHGLVDDTFDWGSHKITIKHNSNAWLLNTNKAKSSGIRFIPWAHYDFFPEMDELKDNTIICWPDMKEQRHSNNALFSDNAISATPFDLYVVERIGLVIDQWLNKLVLDSAGEVKRLPRNAIKLLESKAPGLVDSQSSGQVRVLGVVNDVQQSELIATLRYAGGTNVETMNWFVDRLKDNRKIAECPECGKTAEQLDVTGFDLNCCGIRRSLSQKTYRQYASSSENVAIDFPSQGRMFLSKNLR